MYKQFSLPYSYDALEPHIDAVTMETHYSKHHTGYTNNLNEAVKKLGEEKDIVELLSSLDKIEDEKLRKTIRNNGGGFYNHNIYFDTLSPDGGGEPEGELAEAIKQSFGSFEEMKEKLNELSIGQFGSGWGWLSANKEGKLKLSSTPNQDNPLMENDGYVPIFGIDVWEHAYYLKYKNLRGDYVKNIYNVVNWKRVAELYEEVKRG
ncbi:MAG TPA: superoxide dismutase [Tissierellia bacterium]|nr:superoxide dismutase [Tissierellia bacterium]